MKTLSLTAPTAPVTTVKSVLARLLATENISVEHQDVPTAAFDLKTRTLILPRWKDMSNALYDMLVGHEVSHALFTPQDGWKSDADALSAKHRVDGAVARQYLNIAEDARIERMIKDKFPGLRSDFFKGYGELNAKNFFAVKESEYPTLCLGDRVNLHSKLGLHVDAVLPFTADEAAIRDFVMGAKTWADTVAGADRMLAVDAAKWQKNQQQQEQSPEGESAPQGDDAEDGEDTKDAQGNESEGGEGEDKSESGAGTEGGEDKSQGTAKDNPTETQSGEDDKGSAGKKSDKPCDSMPGPITNSSLENALKSLNETASRAPDVVRLKMTAPTTDVVVPFADVLKDLNAMVTRNNWNTTPVREADYKRASGAMATAFDRRKSADIWKRTTIAKTGAIDPLRMTQYKWNEDIFRRGTRIAEGKNHGIVILLDWSGSMGNIMQQTIGQLLILTDFCRMAGVPFEVYAFCDRAYTVLPDGMDPYSDEAYRLRDAEYKRFTSTDNNTASPCYMRLLNFLSNRMTAAQYERMKSILFHNWNAIGYDSRYGMGGTPTAAALHHASAVVAEFTKRNRVQITLTIVLTDGDATDEYRVTRNGVATRSWVRDTHWVIEDPVTGASYDLWNTQYRDADGKTQTMRRGTVNWETASNRSVCIAIDALRRRTGSKVHWIGLTASQRNAAPSGMGGFVPSEDADWARDGYARGTAAGWDTAVMAAACRFGGKGNNWVEQQLEKMDQKIEGAKTNRNLVTAVVNKQAMTNSLRSLATLIGEFIAVA